MLLRFFFIVATIALAVAQQFPASVAHAEDKTSPQVLELNDQVETISAGRHLELLDDPSGAVTLEEIERQKQEKNFVPSKTDVPNLGYGMGEQWLRLKVKNNATKHDSWFLEVGYSPLDFLELFVRSRGGPFVSLGASGDHVPFIKHEGKTRLPTWEVHLPAGELSEILIHVKTTSSRTYPVVFRSASAQSRFVSVENMLLGIYFGIMLFAAIYNAFVWFAVRDKTYLLYVLHVAVFGLFQVSLNGVGPMFLWPEATTWNSVSLWFSMCLATIIIAWFTIEFLSLNRKSGWPYWMVLVSGVLGPVVIVVNFFVPPNYSAALASAVVLVVGISCPVASVYRWRLGFRAARLFFIGFAIFFVGVIARSLKGLGIFPASFFSEYSLQIGAVIQVVLFSLALADRINDLKRTESHARWTALRAQQKLAARLYYLLETLRGLAAQTNEQTAIEKTCALLRSELDTIASFEVAFVPSSALGSSVAAQDYPVTHATRSFGSLQLRGPIERLEDDDRYFVQTTAETLGFALANIQAAKRLAEEAQHEVRVQAEAERELLVSKLRMAAEISDKLNSPLATVISGLELANAHLLDSLQRKYDNAETAVTEISQGWEKRYSIIHGAVKKLREVAVNLELLRETAAKEETTRILNR